MQTTATFDGTASASGVLAGVADRGQHVLLPAGTAGAVLDEVAAQLAARRSRVLRPSTEDAITLPGLLARIVGRTPDAALEMADLERGFALLTAGQDCDRIVLMLDRADALDDAVLRYLQMAIRDAPLRLLFVGGPKLDGLLARVECQALRRGFTRYASPPVGIVDQAGPNPAMAMQPSRPGHRSGRWLLSGASMVASAVGVAWLVRSGVLAGFADSGLLSSTLSLVSRHWGGATVL